MALSATWTDSAKLNAGTNYSFTSIAIGSGDTVGVFVWSLYFTGTDNPTSVTVGGNSATLKTSLAFNNGGSQNLGSLSYWEAVHPGTSTATIAVNHSASRQNCGIQVFDLVDSVYVQAATNQGSGQVTDLDISLTGIGSGSILLGIGAVGDGDINPVVWTNLAHQDSIDIRSNEWFSAARTSGTESGGSKTVNVDGGGAAKYHGGILVEIEAASADTTINASAEALTLTEYAATIANDVNVSAAAEALTITEYAADISLGVNISANVEALTLTEHAATVANDVNVSAAAEALTITEHQATIGTSSNVNVNANAEALILTEYAATIANDVNVSAAAEALTITEYAAGVTLGVNVGANVEALTLTEYAADITFDVGVSVAAEALTITEYTATVTLGVDVNVSAAAEALTITPQSATLTLDANVSAAVEALAYTTFRATVDGVFVIWTEILPSPANSWSALTPSPGSVWVEIAPGSGNSWAEVGPDA